MADRDICLEVSAQCPIEYTIYGYYPNLPANAFFAAWFGILFLLNLGFGIKYRTWTYMLALCLGCVTEVIGYAGRILLHNNPFDGIGFQMQICCLILGPAFNSAAIYLTLKHVALTFGPEFSILKPRLYTYIFICGDLISLVLQAVGGAMAATADTDQKQQDAGTDIMIAGICWQVVTLFAFGVTVSLYVQRRWSARTTHPLSASQLAVFKDIKFRLFASGVAIAHITIFARCVYRIAEMAGGWQNHIMQDEPSFIAMEGVMIAVAALVQTTFHPGFCFPALSSSRTRRQRVQDVSEEPESKRDTSRTVTPE